MPSASSTAITMIATSSNSEPAVDLDFVAPLPEPTDIAGPPGVPGRARLASFFVERTLTRAPRGLRSRRSVAGGLAGIGGIGLIHRRRRRRRGGALRLLRTGGLHVRLPPGGHVRRTVLHHVLRLRRRTIRL